MNTRPKIGVGIITCNRENFLIECLKSIPLDKIDTLVVVNDGKPLTFTIDESVHLIQHDTSKNVGASKNDAMRFLLEDKCDYIFTIEDDIILKDDNIFEKYIHASKVTGIQHFNFGFSQRENLDQNLQPIYRKVVDYGNNVKIILTQHILGAFTFYTRTALQTIGLHHKKFNKGHGDHLELTYRAFKHGFGTPFWWFADLYESWKMIENQSNLTTDSVVRKPETFMNYFNEARSIFKILHGCDIYEVPDIGEDGVVKILKYIKNENR
jgi:glycosyltransferase involved in cell wall biosynthesis